jgi:hypothetical protein
MADYGYNQGIFNRSLSELKAIANWLERMETSGIIKPLTVLIGGWAVYSYNPWYGSIDIDLVSNSDIKKRLMWHLIEKRQYISDHTVPPTTVYKEVTIGETKQKIRLDFGSRAELNPFEGAKKNPLGFDTLDEHTSSWNMGDGARIRVPDRSALLLYKLKAAWDRGYRVRSGRDSSGLDEFKLEKDYCDILALIDPGQYSDDLDYAFIAEEFEGRDFLRDEIKNLPNKAVPIKRYGNMDRPDVESVCESLLLLTKK